MTAMSILGPPTDGVGYEDVMARLPDTATSLFREAIFPALWRYALALGVVPEGVIAQSGKETAWGIYPGNVKAWFFNTAGIKVRNDQQVMDMLGTTNPNHPLVHQQFPNWDVGALAHVQHLRAYCNQPVEGLIVDPRYQWVIGRHDCRTWADLGGKWARSPTYGTEIEAMIRRLRGEA